MNDFDNQFSGKEKNKGAAHEGEYSFERATASPPKVTEDIVSKTPHKLGIPSPPMKKKKPRVGLIIAIVLSVLILGTAAFFTYRYFSGAVVKNFVGSNFETAMSWGEENQVTVNKESVFSTQFAENTVISQSAPQGKRLNKGAEISLEISKGPDPEEMIELPNFRDMTTNEITAWIRRASAVNVIVGTEFNDTISAGRFIKIECAVNLNEYKRKDTLRIYMSKGKEHFLSDITVPDFSGKAKSNAQEFVNEHILDVSYEEEVSDTVPAGCVISQSVAVGTKIAKHSKISFVISQGKSVTVPNFAAMNKEAAAAIASMNVTVETRYHDNVPNGVLISQSIPAGEVIIGDIAPITVVYSLGRPYLENIVGKREADIEKIFKAFKAGGANIDYTIQHVDSNMPEGTITGASKLNDYLNLSENVDIYVSKGNLGQ